MRYWSQSARFSRVFIALDFIRSFVPLACLLAIPLASADGADKHWNVTGGAFQISGNWSPTGVPGIADNVFVGDLPHVANGFMVSSSDVSIANLSINNGMNVLNGQYQQGMIISASRFSVTGNTTISGLNNAGTSSSPTYFTALGNPNIGNELITGGLTLSNEAYLHLVDDADVQVNGIAQFNANSHLRGTGTIYLTRNASPALIMDGRITAHSSSQITIQQLGTGRIDLDGATIESGVDDYTINMTGRNNINGSIASITLIGDQLSDAFDEAIRMDGESQLNMNLSGGWTMSPSSRFIFGKNFAFPGISTVTGGTLNFQGSMLFDPPNTSPQDTHARFLANVNFGSSATINLGVGDRLELKGNNVVSGSQFFVNNNSVIDFDGMTTVNGVTFATGGTGVVNFNGATKWQGSVVINGEARQHGNATVTAATTIQADRFDFDGATNSQWTVNAPLTITASSLETLSDPQANRVDGGITVNAEVVGTTAYLDVNLTNNQGWTMAGPLTLKGPSSPFSATTLRGSPVTIAGAMVSSGNNTTTARMTVADTGIVGIAAGGSLRLAGGSIASPNMLTGGSFVGVGTLMADPGKALVGYGSINNAINFAGNSELRATGGTLTINGAIQDVGVIGTADASGTLHVTNAWSTGVADKVELLGGKITGGAVANPGLIVGRGTLGMASLVNDGSLTAVGGELLIMPTAPAGADVDGQSNTGVLRAEQGNIRVVPLPTDAFDGTAHVGAGRRLQFDSGWTNNGTLNLNGMAGSPALLSGGGVHVLTGTLNASGEAAMFTPTEIRPTAQVNIPQSSDVLQLGAAIRVDAGASVVGNGRLSNLQGATLNLSDGATVNVLVENSGTLVVGIDTATASVRGLESTSSASIRMGIDGTAISAWDKLMITNTANLAGNLVVPVNGSGGSYSDPSNPGSMDQFSLMTAGSVANRFGHLVYDGQSLIPSFTGADSTKFYVGDGLFRVLDYTATQVVFSNYRALPGDANGDGSVDGSDFSIWNAHKFTGGTNWISGDFNGDGVTDGSDFAIWNAHKFTSLATISVPEPNSWLLLLAAASCRMILRRRHSKY